MSTKLYVLTYNEPKVYITFQVIKNLYHSIISHNELVMEVYFLKVNRNILCSLLSGYYVGRAHPTTAARFSAEAHSKSQSQCNLFPSGSGIRGPCRDLPFERVGSSSIICIFSYFKHSFKFFDASILIFIKFAVPTKKVSAYLLSPRVV